MGAEIFRAKIPMDVRTVATELEHWPLNRLLPYVRNSRTHSQDQVNRIAASMRRFGFTIPILVDERGQIIAGHGRALAAEILQLNTVPTIVARNWTEQEKRAYVIADNQLALDAGWDVDLLKEELQQLKNDAFDLDVIGFSEDALDLIMADAIEPVPQNADDIPQIPSNPQTKSGDVWQFKGHILKCADCRDAMTFHNTTPINLAFTSPPYAEQREYDETSGFRPINPDDYVDWFKPIAQNLHRHLTDDGSFFLNIKPSASGLDTELYVMDLVIAHVRKWNWHFATEFCWERTGVPKGVTQRFKNQFEPIYQFVKSRWKMRPDAVRHQSDHVPMAAGPGVGNTSWKTKQGGNGAMFGADIKRHKNGTKATMSHMQGVNVAVNEGHGPGLAFPGNRLPTFTETHTATGHAAAFPVGLPEFFIKAYSDAGDTICDPFAGSGSTLIACERTQRQCFAIEISPAYCDVILQRWCDFTHGHTMPVNQRGEPFKAKRPEDLLMAG